MSMPIIQNPENPVNREQSINDLIESVALMETGLSHILNAEGEKIQKAVDPDADYPLDDIIAVNNSAERMINTVSKLEMMLQSKLETSKDLDTGTEPPGPIVEDSGAIIQYNSQITMTTTTAGLPENAALLSFETGSASYTIDLNGNPEVFEFPIGHSVFPMPRDGILTSISAFFELIANVSAENQVTARIYKADPYSTTYYPLENAIVNLAPVIPAGTTNLSLVGSVSGLNIPLEVNSKIGILFYCTASTIANVSVSGIAGGAINIQ